MVDNTLFQAALDAKYADNNFAQDGTVNVSGGGAIPCRVVLMLRDDPGDSEYGIITKERVLKIRVSEVAALSEADTITTNDDDGVEQTYPVVAPSRPGNRRLEWEVGLGEPVI